jgi:hypothetical protein
MSDLLQRLDDEDEIDEQEEFIQSFIHETNQQDTVPMEVDNYHYIPSNTANSIVASGDIHKSLNNEHESLKPFVDADNEFNYQNKVDQQEEYIQTFIHEVDQLDTALMEIDNDNYEVFDTSKLQSTLNYNDGAPDTLKPPILNSTDLIIAPDDTHKPLNNEYKPLKSLIDINNEFSYQNEVDDASSNTSMVSDLNNSLGGKDESLINNQSDNYYRLFWIDAVEKSGLVYMVGKVY